MLGEECRVLDEAVGGSLADAQQTCDLGRGCRVGEVRPPPSGIRPPILRRDSRAGEILQETVFEEFPQFVGGVDHLRVDPGFLGTQ
ncbi:hypothetical protein MN0502_20890 [Arthrobacter sp. MN05-02]|nr:hypothetical protein MN0502_20890 [Arthrobacter sp. MN05-02]